MEKSTLYDELSMGILRKWKSIEEKNEDIFTPREKELFEELNNGLNEKSKELLSSYSLAVENKMNYINYNLNIKILNLGIKIGMELESAIHECEDHYNQ